MEEIVEDLRIELDQRLDMRRQAEAFVLLAEELRGESRVVVPRPVLDLCAPRVLVLESLGVEIGKLFMTD